MEVLENALNQFERTKTDVFENALHSTMSFTNPEQCERRKSDIFGSVFGPFHIAPFCYDPFLLHQRYPFTFLRFLKKRRENIRFVMIRFCFLSDSKYGAKDNRFRALT